MLFGDVQTCEKVRTGEKVSISIKAAALISDLAFFVIHSEGILVHSSLQQCFNAATLKSFFGICNVSKIMQLCLCQNVNPGFE